ncbi:MAG: HlyD family efflux transporter periplasmic adaptor subunit [Oscillospiraceae bacterium]|jgi:multidrug efflux pump subunit AcrA (membrane-fusion protein)|nr:HlyD family efflux transporter periplasmic adaptor subunit [Oscillospiraceae bacterium]
MSEQTVKKREWVLKAVIIFLALMLVLTFFSNTIMNRSLPEVAVQYTTSGSVSPKIRGSGVVTANEQYEITLSQTRTVEAVNVRVGHEVTTGDLLFTLSGGSSDELDAARIELDALLLAYQKAVVNASLNGDYAQENRDIENARAELTAAQEALAAISYSDERIAAAETAVNTAKLEVARQQAAVDVAQANLDALGGRIPGEDRSEINNKITAKNTEITLKTNEIADAKVVYKESLDAFDVYVEDFYGEEGWKELTDSQKEIFKDTAAASLDVGDMRRVAYEIITSLNGQLKTLNDQLNELKAQRDSLETGNLTQYDRLAQRLADAKTALATAQTQQTNAETRLENEKGYKAAWTEANTRVKTAQTALEDLLFDLAEKQKTDNVTNQVEALDLADMKRQYERKRDEVTELEGDSVGGTVTSPVSGIVKSIGVSAGNSAEAGVPLAVIEVADRGYSVNMTVTVEQSRRVSIGDVAEVNTGWWGGGNIQATLVSIRNDPENPATSRILSFDISGQVESGSQLNLVLGEKSANYECLVPNSALRSDTNGDFVLIVMAKNSPLGNRYVATRVDVTVIASDDTNTAVSGGLQSYEYVIVTANKPVEAGMQVKMVDNP